MEAEETKKGYLLCMLALIIVMNVALATGSCTEPCLYYAQMNAIRRIHLQSSTGKATAGTTIETVYRGGQRITAMTLDHAGGRMFWYDFGSRVIYKANLNGTGVTQLIKYGVSLCEGLAYDWSTNNVYWTDSWHDWIAVASADGRNRKVIINGSMEFPRGIIVAPNAGYVFWTEFGRNPRIERARLNGAERQAIVTSGLVYPNDLQIDYSNKLLYWIDAYTDKVESSDYAGRGRRVVSDVSHYGQIYMHIFSMALYAQHSLIYLTDWHRSWVLYKHIAGDQSLRVIVQNKRNWARIGQVRILHSSNQPAASSPCLQNNGNCSHMCLRKNATSYTCECPTGAMLAGPRSKQCMKAELDFQAFVLDGSSSSSKIFHLSKFVGQPQYLFDTLKLRVSGSPIGVDFDQKQDMLYWGDVKLNKIFKMHLNGSGFQVISDKLLETPEGIAIDTVTGVLYLADFNYEKIEVLKLDGSMRKTLMVKDIVNPRDVQLFHEKGLMFFSDWGRDHPKIESAFMDGTHRRVIVDTNIDAPSGLAIDKTDERLYWCDMSMDVIESANLDGTERRTLFDHDGYDLNFPMESVTGEIRTPYGLAVHREKVYWTDWTNRAVFSADKRFGDKIDRIIGSLIRPMQIHIYSRKVVKEYKKIYFFSHAKINASNPQSYWCFAKNCTGKVANDPVPCPQGYKQSRLNVTCANCSAPFGMFNVRCKCEDWMSCAHRVHSKLSCPSFQPFMKIKVRECVKAINPGHCPSSSCPSALSPNCSSDGDCSDDQKCCNTTCGEKCLQSSLQPMTHPCQLKNGGCSHFCFRIPESYACGCPNTMVLQPADNKSCIYKSGYCATKKPCVNGGICRDRNASSFECSCKSGFSGVRCEMCSECSSNTTCIKNGNVTTCQCLPNFCKNNGTCAVDRNQAVCTCMEGFIGEKCQISHRCPPNYCSNNGSCTISKDGFKCNCTKAFTGQRCETLKSCIPNPCSNGGTCSNQGILPICNCSPGYTGKKCETPAGCDPNPCLNNGMCRVSGNAITCQCAQGYSGDRCQYYDHCLSGPCENNATCSSVKNNTKCKCLPNFTGTFCESPIPCSEEFCKNGGTCFLSNNERKCKCPAYYTGKSCETYAACSCNPCQHDGQCKPAINGTFQCVCPNGYTGKTCQYKDKCISNPCRNGATCMNMVSGSGYKCECTSGYTGPKCETIDRCASNPCKNSGTCQLRGPKYVCKCTSGFTGPNCESIDSCASNPCKNSGTCQLNDASYKCNCNEGYKGVNCDTQDFCVGNQCRKSELCRNAPTGYTCLCDAGYTGQYCRIHINYCQPGAFCQNGGTCSHTSLEGSSCYCTAYFVGERCQIGIGENILQVVFSTTSSSTISRNKIKGTLSTEYTSYCQNTDCSGKTVAIRKKRDVKNPVVVTADDVIVLPDYPKKAEDSTLELRFSVLGKTNGKVLVLPASVIQGGFQAFNSSFAAALGVKVLKVQLIRPDAPKVGKSKGDKNSKEGGLIAGLILLFLCLVAIMVGLSYFYKKRREGEDKTFTSFENAIYRSNAELNDEKEPSVEIGWPSTPKTEEKDARRPFEFDNNIYDGRNTYSDIVTADLTADAYTRKDTNEVQMESGDGMTGVVNPYMELPEHEKKMSNITRTDSVTIMSSSNVKVGAIAAIEVYERGLAPAKESRAAHSPIIEAGKTVHVKSMNDDAVDGLSGFANPCAAMDDYIFSEDDTRDAIDFPDIQQGDSVQGTFDGDKKDVEQDMVASSQTTDENAAQRNKGNWVNVENESAFESSA